MLLLHGGLLCERQMLIDVLTPLRKVEINYNTIGTLLIQWEVSELVALYSVV